MKPAPRCLTLLPSLRCPLQCAHCGNDSGPTRAGEMSPRKARQALLEARRLGASLVNISGGEPFALGARLPALVRTAANLGFFVRVTTGGAWSRDPKRAAARLAPLARAGLRQLVLSTSPQHAAFVPPAFLVHAAHAARGLGVDVLLSRVRAGPDDPSFERLLEAFAEAGESPPSIAQRPLAPFGRAARPDLAEEAAGATAALELHPPERFSTACPSVLRTPAVHPDGTVTACSSVFAGDCDPLRSRRGALESAFARMGRDPLLQAIATLGPLALRRMAEQDGAVLAPRVTGLCHLCGDLLGRPDVVDRLRHRLFEFEGPGRVAALLDKIY